MHLRLLAIGDRQPSWVDEAFDAYAARFPREWRFRLDALPTARRTRNAPPKRAAEQESATLVDRLRDDEQLILLDERGTELSTAGLARRLAGWQQDGRDLAFAIGGPDGVSVACRERADFVWSLSRLTLPHGLVRVLFAEQMYRAWSLTAGHPYHRE